MSEMLPPPPALVRWYFENRRPAGSEGFSPEAVASNEALWRALCEHGWAATEPGFVNSATHVPDVNASLSQPQSSASNRRVYMREYMRQRRAAARGGG